MRAVYPSDRAAAYSTLVTARKSCRTCIGLNNLADCDGGIYDTDQIGPGSLWQRNLSADLMIVCQDWGRPAVLSQEPRPGPRTSEHLG
jgi:hypothetical protein